MVLKEEQKTMIKERLNETKNDRSACDICGSNEWMVLDKVWALIEAPDVNGGIEQNVSAIPLIAVMCQKCGHVHLLNSIQYGITPQSKKEDLEVSDTKDEHK